MKKTKKNPRRGSSFEDFLREDGKLEEVTATATKRVLVWQLVQAMKRQRLTKSALAKRMGTSRIPYQENTVPGAHVPASARCAKSMSMK